MRGDEEEIVVNAEIDKIDIAQLRVFSAMYEHRSVIRVSRVLDMPQPTVSRWLARLRTSFGDPLFVRTQDGMEPTPAAALYVDAVDSILDIHRTRLLRCGDFDPLVTQRNFKIAASDFGHLVCLARLHDWSRNTAPLASFTAVPLGRKNLITQLEQGGADLAVGGFPALTAGIKEQTLFEDHYLCVMREGHPLSDGDVTLDAFCSAKHILVRAHAVGHVQQEVEQRMLEVLPHSNIRLTSESFVAAALMVPRGDLILTAPARVFFHLEKRLRLVRRPVPLDLPKFVVKQYWHERFDKDPGNQWLRRGMSTLALDKK